MSINPLVSEGKGRGVGVEFSTIQGHFIRKKLGSTELRFVFCGKREGGREALSVWGPKKSGGSLVYLGKRDGERPYIFLLTHIVGGRERLCTQEVVERYLT